MAIYNFPAGICITEVTLTEANSVGAVISPYSFARETQDWGGGQWRMMIEFLPVSRAEADPLEAFISQLRGGLNGFRMGDPYRSTTRGVNTGTPTVLSATLGSVTIETQGWTDSSEPPLYANDLIQVEDHLYKVLDDASIEGASGDAGVWVWPRVRKAYAVDTPVVINNARGVFTLADNSPSFSRNRFGRFWTSLQAVEML